MRFFGFIQKEGAASRGTYLHSFQASSQTHVVMLPEHQNRQTKQRRHSNTISLTHLAVYEEDMMASEMSYKKIMKEEVTC